MYCPWWECIDEDGSMSFHWYNEDRSMGCHWYMMKMDQCGFIGIWCIVEKCIDDSLLYYHDWQGAQMYELQSGPLMVKVLMGRHFVDWVILE